MNATDQTHPSRDELTAYLAGKLNAVESDNIKQHLAACDTCCDLVDSLPTDDTIVAALRQQEAETSVSSDVDSANVIAPTITPEAEDGTQAVRGQTTKVAGLGADQLNLPAELRDHPRYRIVELLGHGGMGDVYRAEHKVMSRQVALKVIKPQLVRNDAAVRRFQREVKAAARLHHPNIVTAYDAEQAGDLHYLVMEFVDGVDLDEVIRERGPLPVEEACEYIRQAAEGLQYAHELGMVHRDIKPHNLMVEVGQASSMSSRGNDKLEAYPTLKILDFGLANFASEVAEDELKHPEAGDETGAQALESTVAGASILHQLTQMGTMMGTPDYIAPEQARDAHTADIRSDIYSLGCTFFTLLTGKAPFGEGSVLDKVKSHTEKDAPPLSDFRDDVPPDVEAVLKKMMAKDPAERFQTPADVAEALSVLESSLQAPDPDTRRLKPGLQRKRPLVLTAVATLFLALLAAAATIFYIQTDNGVVRVEVTDPSLQVTISGQTITTDDNGKPLTIRAGEQKLIVRQKDSDFELVTDSFQLRRGDRVALKVDLLPGEVVVSKKDGTRLGAKPLPLDQLIAQEWKRLEGRWQAIDGQQEGAPLDPEEVGGLQLVIKDRKITFYDHGRADPGVADIQPAANPKQLDITVQKVAAASDGRSTSAYPSTVFGIYKLEGDRLTICLAEDGRPRPKVFDTKPAPGGGTHLMVLRRQETTSESANEVVVSYTKPRNGAPVIKLEGETLKNPPELFTRLQSLVKKDPGLVVRLEGDLDPRVPDFTQLYSLVTSAGVTQIKLPSGMREEWSQAMRQHMVEGLGERKNAIKQIGLGLLNYHDTHKFFPPTKHNREHFAEYGRPHLSWRVHILPYIEQEDLYKEFHLDEPWDSEHNKALLAKIPPQYKTTDDPTKTTMLAVVGEGTAYEGQAGLKIADFKDGMSNTAFVVDAGRERAVPWTKPEDLPFDSEDPIRAFGTSDFGDEFLALMADGSVQSIPQDTAPESLRALFTRAAGDSFDKNAKRTTPLPKYEAPKDELKPLGQLEGHDRTVIDLAWHPDGKRAVSIGSRDAEVRMWDVAERKTLWTWKPTTKVENQRDHYTIAVTISADGKRVAAGDADGTIYLLDAENGKELKSWPAYEDGKFTHAGIAALDFSPDGELLASVGRDQGTGKVWQLKTGKQVINHINGPDAFDIAFSQDGEAMISAGYSAKYREVDEDKDGLKIISGGGGTGHDLKPQSVAVSPRGDLYAYGYPRGEIYLYKRKERNVWSATKLSPGMRFDHAGTFVELAFTPDGRHLISGSPSLIIWSYTVEDGKFTLRPILEKKSDSDGFFNFALSPDGKTLLTIGDEDGTSGPIHIWQLPQSVWPEEPPMELSLEQTLKGHSGLGVSTASLATTPDGKLLISAGGKDKTARLWDTDSGETLLVMPMENDGPVSVAITADGKLAAVRGTNGHIDLWDLGKKEKLQSLDQTEVRGAAMAFSADGRRLVTGALPSGDRKPLSIVWDVESGERLHVHRFPFDEPVGAIVAVPGTDDVVFTAKRYWRWNTATGHLAPLPDWPESLGGDIDVSSSGRHAAIVTNETISLQPVKKRFSVEIRDLESGRRVKQLDSGELELGSGTPKMPVSVCFLAGDRRIAVAYMHGEIRVFDIESGREVARKEGMAPMPNLVALDDQRLATTGVALDAEPNHDIQIWRLPEK